MQYHEVKVNLEFRELSDCYFAGTISGGAITASQSAVTPGSLGTTSLFVDYIYLDTDERRRFAQVSHEYLIEQLQFTGDESTSTVSNKVKLNFNHPVKELIWVVQPDAHLDNASTAAFRGKQWFNYADNFDVTYHTSGGFVAGDSNALLVNNADTSVGSMPGVAAGGANGVFLPVSFENGANPVASAKLQLNGHDRFSERDGRYFNLVQPYQHHENVPSQGINVYSFGLKPEEHQPSGTCNMSRIDNATLQLTLTSQTVTGGRSAKIRVYAVNYNVLRIMSGQTQARNNYVKATQIHIVSGLFIQTAKSLVVGNTLKPLTPSWCLKTPMAEKTNSGMVKVKWTMHTMYAEMGNPHAYCLNKTKRQRLNGDWWLTQQSQLLKVQSSLQGNLNGYTDGWSCLLQLECQLYCWQDYSYYLPFLILHSNNENAYVVIPSIFKT